jgi:hypothetical protein
MVTGLTSQASRGSSAENTDSVDVIFDTDGWLCLVADEESDEFEVEDEWQTATVEETKR